MLKYSNRRDIAKHFGIVLYEELLDEWSERKQFARFENPLLIPIPISKKKLKKRGYNQTALIVKEILNNDANNYFSADFSSLQKIKETPSQMSLRDRRKRLANLHDAFHVSNPEKIRGRNIILIDDITTTGATLAEARRALKYAGANKFICFAVAH